jgi:predicted DNA-binding protein
MFLYLSSLIILQQAGLPPDIDKPLSREYNLNKCDTRKGDIMPLSLRMKPEKEKMIKRAAAKAGKTKSAFILEALDEKLGLAEDRGQTIRKLSGWLSKEDAKKLRESTDIFGQVHKGDWD